MKKTILISVYDMQIGGIERSLINMLESFDYDKYEVDLFIFHHAGDFFSLIPDKVNILKQENKYAVFRKPIAQCVKEGHHATSAVRLASKAAASIKAFRRNLEEGPGYIQMQLVSKYTPYFLPKIRKKYDIAFSYAWPHDVLLKKVNANTKIAWIHTDYSQLEIDNKIDLKMWNAFDYIVSISDECTKAFLSVYPSLESKIILIENITSPQFIKKMADSKEAPVKQKMTEHTFNLLTVGRLSYVKGFDIAVKALKELHDRGYTDIKWYVVGEGSYEKELRELIDQHDLADSFILLGKKANPYPYFTRCDLYVQPSRYEGKAVVVTEAKILGKPILLTNYPTAPSQIKDGEEGLICEFGEKGLAEGIEKFYKNKEFKDRITNHVKSQDYNNSDELKKLYNLIG